MNRKLKNFFHKKFFQSFFFPDLFNLNFCLISQIWLIFFSRKSLVSRVFFYDASRIGGEIFLKIFSIFFLAKQHLNKHFLALRTEVSLLTKSKIEQKIFLHFFAFKRVSKKFSRFFFFIKDSVEFLHETIRATRYKMNSLLKRNNDQPRQTTSFLVEKNWQIFFFSALIFLKFLRKKFIII